MSKKIILSVIIPTYNRSTLLKECLESLSNQTLKSFEVIVVDDGSTYDVSKIVNSFSRRFNKISLIRIEKNTGRPGFVRNQGINIVKGRLVAFIDDDCIADEKWAEKIIFSHKEFRDINVIQGSLDNPDKNNIYGVLWKLILDYRLHSENYDMIGPNNLSVKKTLLNNISFNNNLFTREDEYFRQMLKIKEEKILYNPKIKVMNVCRTNLFSFLKQNFMYGVGDAQLKEIVGAKYHNKVMRGFFKELYTKVDLKNALGMSLLVFLKGLTYRLGYFLKKWHLN